jgi:hypothetical protein
MSAYTDELARLRAANPAPVEPDRGRTPAAMATLARILQDPIDEAIQPRSGGRSRGRGGVRGDGPAGVVERQPDVCEVRL